MDVLLIYTDCCAYPSTSLPWPSSLPPVAVLYDSDRIAAAYHLTFCLFEGIGETRRAPSPPSWWSGTEAIAHKGRGRGGAKDLIQRNNKLAEDEGEVVREGGRASLTATGPIQNLRKLLGCSPSVKVIVILPHHFTATCLGELCI